MLEEKKEEKKSKRREFEELVNGLQKLGWHYDTIALTEARRCGEAQREGARRMLTEPLALTEEEKQFDEEYKREMEAGCRMTAEEWEKWKEKRTKKWWYMFGRVDIKKDINQMKSNYMLALAAQDEVCSELEAEARDEENKEWFRSLTHEDKIVARGALWKQRVTSIKLQNQLLQVWEKQLVSLNASIKDFSFID